ncbi:MAG: carboxylating nicotinate-nucleotide diphosphorylase [Pseudomonadota bacterium]
MTTDRHYRSSPTPDFILQDLVHKALQEDLGRAGDLTTQAVIAENIVTSGSIVARKPGVIAGLPLAERAFKALAPDTIFESYQHDGDRVEANSTIAKITAPAKALLSAERVALNFLGHLSGIATYTRAFVDAIQTTQAQICDTRKTTPGLRTLEKYAVHMGGGCNHRFGLDDAAMIKDNHIALAGGLERAITRAKTNLGHMVKIEVEVDTLEQLDLVLNFNIDAVLLDNMSAETLAEAVRRVKKRFITEASGGVTLDNALHIAKSGVDLISVGALTHSAPSLDVGLDFDLCTS